MKKDSIVIASCARTAIGNFLGMYKDIPATQLGSTAIRACLERAKIKPDKIDEVIMGCVLSAGLGQAPARQAAIYGGIPPHVGATTVNKICGSAMKAVMFALNTIAAGNANVIIAGGMENMSRAPYLLAKARQGYRIGEDKLLDHMMLDGLEDAYEKGKPMGYFAELCAQQYKFSRQQQDEYAKRSLQRARKASSENLFKDEIVPVIYQDKKNQQYTLSLDEGPQTVTENKIDKLKPAFISDGTITAANSSSISDGASTLLVMSISKAEELSIPPLAKIIGIESHAQQSALFTTAPIFAIEKLLKKIQWQADEVDLFEINEAFAVVTMAAMHELNLPHEKVNIHGGACVLGHPIGSTGARIIITLIYALKHYQLKKGIAALCIGGGEATAIAIEII